MNCESEKRYDQRGFTLLECMFALVIIAIGLTAALGLVTSAINLQTVSRDTNTANGLATEKIESLRNYEPSAAERTRGGSVAANVTNYNDSPDSRFLRRWLIEEHPTDAGVPEGTQRITVAVMPNGPGIRLPDIQIQILLTK